MTTAAQTETCSYCETRFADWNPVDYQHYPECPTLDALPPPPPPPPTTGEGNGYEHLNSPAAADDSRTQGAQAPQQPKDFTNNELAETGGFPPRIVLDVSSPNLIEKALLAGSNLAITQPIREHQYDENGGVKAYASQAIRVRKDAIRMWERQDGSPVKDRNDNQIFSVECTLIHNDADFNGMKVEIASGGAAIVQAMRQVPNGITVNIVRLPDVGRMMQYRIMEAL